MATKGDNHEGEIVFINGGCQPTPKKGKRKGWLDFTALGLRAWRWILQNKALCVSLCINIILVSIVAYLASYKYEQPCISSPPLCPDDSHMHRRKCYYLSIEESNWTASLEFCSSSNSTLARIEIDEEGFLKGLMQNEPFWIGLRKSDQQWKWTDGENATKPAGDGGDCAYLRALKKLETFSGRCNIPHRFICKFEVP